jgi:hypothetical protein
MIPDLCPRCGNEWSRGIVIWQSACGLQYRHGLDEYRLPLGASSRTSLWWESDHKTCSLYYGRDEGTITLPYLPFTVSREDIEKWLVLV